MLSGIWKIEMKYFKYYFNNTGGKNYTLNVRIEVHTEGNTYYHACEPNPGFEHYVIVKDKYSVPIGYAYWIDVFNWNQKVW